MKNSFLLFIFFIWTASACYGQQALSPFPLSAVQVVKGPFLEAQKTDLAYILKLDPDRLLAPFLKEAGIEPKKPNYGNWENTGLDGHIGGHYLSALANMYASTGNKEIHQRLGYMIDWLDSCQIKNGNGYISGVPGGKAMWNEIAQGKINANSFSLNDKWVPLYNLHKLLAGLIDAYSIAGNEKARQSLIKLSDWFITLTRNLSEEQIQQMLKSEHGGINEVLADVAVITGNQKYVEAARKFSHQHLLSPLLQNQDALTGMHANTQIPKVIGFKRISEITGDTRWENAADFFWKTVVNNRTVSIGGNSVREHFHPSSDFTSMINDVQGPETCNTYNMVHLTKQLFLTNPKREYLDYYERALYNHILSSQHPNGGFVYFTPMRPQHYRVYSSPQESFWCCVGSGLENHGKYAELIYAHSSQDLYVNLFMPSKLEWKEKGLTLLQQTNFPNEETSSIKLTLKKPLSFALHIRKPGWVSAGQMQVRVNGKAWKATTNAAGFTVVNRTWKTGDVIDVVLPMQAKLEYLPDGSPWASFIYGPLVLAAKTDTSNLTGLYADNSRMGHVANGKLYPIYTAPVIVKSSQDQDNAIKLTPVKGNTLAFSASSVIQPAAFQNIVLQPFYTINDARYMIYWRVTDKEGLQQLQENLKKNEADKIALEARTVDHVALGEQQSEVEHQFKGEKTESGSLNDWHWRNTTSWISYQLDNKTRAGKTIRINLHEADKQVPFTLLVKGKPIQKSLTQNGSTANGFVVDFNLPAEFTQSSDNSLDVKILATGNSKTPRIFSIYLLK